MDFTPTEAQQDLAGLARRILSDWEGRTPERDCSGLDRPLWASLARAGLLDAALPGAVGGGGFGLLEQCAVLIEVGRTVAPAPYLTSIVAAASAIAEFGGANPADGSTRPSEGGPEARPSGRIGDEASLRRGHNVELSGVESNTAERWVLPVVRGERTLTVALADEGSAPAFTAERTGDGWRLSGVQTAVPAGAFADGFLCEASTSEGDALFLVDRMHPGVVIADQHAVDGTDAALVELVDVVLEGSALVGPPGSGAPEWTRQRATIGVCAHQFGVLERAVELTAAYARERVQFGNPIGSFQAVRQRLADAYVDVEAVRLTLWQAAWRLSEGLPASAEVATAKFWAAQAGHRVAHTCVHIHGGVGIDVDYPLHRYFVAAKRDEFALGGATAQLRALGTLLADEPA